MHFDPLAFKIELIYTLIVVFLCFIVYLRTKEMYDLTKHKGIKYFRNAFLLFGLAYVSRFLIAMIQFSIIAFDLFIIPNRMLFPIFMIPVGYFSTLAIFYLAYSLVWRKFKFEHFALWSNLTAAVFSIIAFVSKSHGILSLIQLVLILLTIVLVFIKHMKTKKYNTLVLYFSVLVFWLVNLFLIGPRKMIPLEVNMLFQIISVFVFIILYYKVSKWTK